MTWFYENLMSIIAVTISIMAFITVQRGVSSRARTEAVRSVQSEVTRLNTKLEQEVGKLQAGLDQCIKERVTFKEEIMGLKKSLKLANIEVGELRLDDGQAKTD